MLVRRVYEFYKSGVSVDRIARRYPQVRLAALLDALSFALDNDELMETDFARERALLAQADSSPTNDALIAESERLPFDGRTPAGGLVSLNRA